MKKLLLLLLLVPVITIGQEINNTNSNDIKVESNNFYVQAANMKAQGEGISYLGDGKYRIQQTGPNDMSSYKKQVKKAKAKIQSYSAGLGLNYKIINEEKSNVPVGFGVARTIISFRLINKDGTNYVNKEDVRLTKEAAKKELIELKEYLDMGIITQEEFNNKAVSLKKILLGN